LNAVTDETGGFQFVNLPSGSYVLAATADGYIAGEFGQRSVNGPGIPISVVAGQPPPSIIFPLKPLGVIAGRIRSTDGNPMPNASIYLYKAIYLDGRRTMLLWQQSRTDEYGEYRIPSLPPGQYVVSALSRGTPGRGEGFLPVYSPGTIEIDAATLIDMSAGLEFGGVDVTVTEQDSLHIRGRVFDGLNRTSPSAFFVTLAALGQRTVIGGATVPRQVFTMDDGSFDINGIVPGSYDLIATLGDGEGRLATRMRVDLTRSDVDDLLLVLQPAFQVSGRVVIDGAALAREAVKVTDARVSLVQEPFIAQVSPLPAAVADDGTFVLKGMIPGEYRIRVDTRFDSFVSRASWGSADILNSVVPIDGDRGNDLYVNVDPRVGALDAIVFDNKNEPAAGVQVVLAPEAPNRDRIDLYQSGKTAANGGFQFKNLPPGDYKLFAWESVESGIWQDLNFLSRYEDLGKRVHIGEAAKENVDVRLIVDRR
jgi:hypothetical protein